MNAIFDILKKATGSYSGEGINHENEKFIGIFDLQQILGGRGFQIRFEAKSLVPPAIVHHSEISTIAPNSSNGLSLFNFNSNTPFLAEHVYIKDSNPNQMTFRFGDVENKNSFREEVHIHVGENSIRYEYYWGLPGGEFQYRSGATMRLKARQ